MDVHAGCVKEDGNNYVHVLMAVAACPSLATQPWQADLRLQYLWS